MPRPDNGEQVFYGWIPGHGGACALRVLECLHPRTLKRARYGEMQFAERIPA
jgi:hypothetical protein